MMPDAPPRLSTMNCWPKASVRSWAIIRATTSFVPPGGNGTMTRTGFDGYGACAAAKPKCQARQTPRTKRARTERRLMGHSGRGKATAGNSQNRAGAFWHGPAQGGTRAAVIADMPRTAVSTFPKHPDLARAACAAALIFCGLSAHAACGRDQYFAPQDVSHVAALARPH